MEELFKERYRIPTTRVSWHNYNGGIYFITICTQDKEHYFGEISNGKMTFNTLGNHLYQQIIETPSIRLDMNMQIPLFVIMPNHIHLIVIIEGNEYNKIDYQNTFAPQRKNIASIIRGIKSSTTKFARENKISFQWQTRFYDRIIRNQSELNNVSNYIENNIINWENDVLYTL